MDGRNLLVVVFVAVAYFALAKLGLTLASLHPSASPVWPPSGLALAAVLIWGWRVVWPGIFVAAFFANLTISGATWSSVVIAAGNTLEALLTAWLLQHWSGGQVTFETPLRVAKFAALALAPGTMVSATLGVGSLVLSGQADVSKFTSIWTTWWLGDVGGQLLVAPVIILWAVSHDLDREHWRRLTMLLVGTAIVGVLAFSPLLRETVLRGPIAFLAIGPMLWAALRHQQRDTATAALVLSCFAIWGTLANWGPFAGPNLNQSFLLALTFVISTSVPSLMLSADVAVRRLTEKNLRTLHAEIDQKVDTRTAELASAKLQLEGAQRLANLGNWIWDIPGNTVTWSDELLRIFGVSREAFQGTFDDFLARVHDGDRARIEAGIREALTLGEGFSMEERIVRPDGKIRYLRSFGEVIKDTQGRPVQMIGACQDVTEHRQAQAALDAARDQLAQSQKMEALGQLTGGIAHDFNNVLAIISSNLESLRKRTPQKPRLSPLIDNSLEAVQRAAALTQRMLAFARRQELKPVPVDIRKLVDGMVELLKRSLGTSVDVMTDIPERIPHAMVDANQLELAIMNLALNSRDAMPSGGTLMISARERALSTGGGRLVAGRYVCISVTDTGTGMDEATLARATEPFFTSKDLGKGTGLGLSMVEGLATQSGGRLELRSTPERGTTATLWLPASDESPSSAAERLERPQELRSNANAAKILVVDDDPLVLMGTVAMLEDLGHFPIQATSGPTALSLLQSGTAVDLLIVDQAMPGMTGSELIDRVRERWPSMRVILATGYADLEGAKWDFPILRKPFLQQELGRVIAGEIKV